MSELNNLIIRSLSNHRQFSRTNSNLAQNLKKKGNIDIHTIAYYYWLHLDLYINTIHFSEDKKKTPLIIKDIIFYL